MLKQFLFPGTVCNERANTRIGNYKVLWTTAMTHQDHDSAKCNPPNRLVKGLHDLYCSLSVFAQRP